MQPDLHLNPYERPLGWRAYSALALAALVLATGVGLALTAERWVHEKWVKESLAAFIAPYQELFLASLPGEDGAEYVIFLTDNSQSPQAERYLAAQSIERVQREDIFAGTMVVKLRQDVPEVLAKLRAQPFVRFTVRNQGLFFCH